MYNAQQQADGADQEQQEPQSESKNGGKDEEVTDVDFEEVK